MKVNYWQKRWKSGEPFPVQGQNNEFDIKECFAWVQKNLHILKKEGTQPDLFNESEEARYSQKIIAAKREQFEFDKEQGLYVLRDEAYQKIVAALTRFKLFVREEIEKRSIVERREKLKALGVSDDSITQFFVWDKEREIGVMDAIETRCEQEANGEDAITI